MLKFLLVPIVAELSRVSRVCSKAQKILVLTKLSVYINPFHVSGYEML